MTKRKDTKTRVEEAYRKLKQMMLQQKIVPGQKLLYRELADWLKMSKTPIINALNRLEQEGFIVSEANRGFYVKPMDTKEIMDCYEVREALEIKSLEQAIRFGTSIDIEFLTHKARDFENYPNYDAGKKKLMLNAEFHLHIATISQNQVLKYLIRRNLEHIMLRLRLANFSFKKMGASSREHFRLIEAIRQKNVSKGAAIIRDHIRQSREHIIAGVSIIEIGDQESEAFFEEERQ